MWCAKCNRDLRECQCSDLADRLRAISNSSYVELQWCTMCDKPRSRCRCVNPLWGVRSGGKIELFQKSEQPFKMKEGVMLHELNEHTPQLRKVEVCRGEVWTAIRLRDLRKGDIFCMFEPDGSFVERGATFVAVEDPELSVEECDFASVWSVVADHHASHR